METPVGSSWRPIEDLPADWEAWRRPELHALVAVWGQQKVKLGGTDVLRDFNARLLRAWSIETGILERIYTLDRSVTLTLVEQGLSAALIPHGASDLPPRKLVTILQDHLEAAQGLFDFVKGNRSLTHVYIRELHQVLTRHQDTSEGVDQFGNLRDVPLLRGEYKRWPNNPGDPETGVLKHEYCPPVHVQSEMDRLIRWHGEHANVPFEVEAAWLHHRFTRIHPFQDGNGRVARALASIVCIRSGGFPLVVHRDQSSAYIDALRQADRGDLGPLVSLIAGIQKERFIQALGLSAQVLDRHAMLEAIVSDARSRLETALLHRMDSVHRLVDTLVSLTVQQFESVAQMLNRELRGIRDFEARAGGSGADDAHWFRGEILETARHLDYKPNLSADSRWARLRLRHGPVTQIVVSFHHLGRADEGVMVATAMLSTSDTVQRGGVETKEFTMPVPYRTAPACEEVFTITAGREEAELRQSFADWLQRSLRIALDAWRRAL